MRDEKRRGEEKGNDMRPITGKVLEKVHAKFMHSYANDNPRLPGSICCRYVLSRST